MRITLLWFFLLPTVVRAQVTVANMLTPAELVAMLAGEGITTSNVTFNGDVVDTAVVNAGTFTAANSNLAIASGIVLCTGLLGSIPQAASISMHDNLWMSQNDPDLLALAQETDPLAESIHNEAILEFDFVPVGDSIRFRFVFASEEYPEYVCNFNDAFGFFLSGPGISGGYSNNAENIALIPGTDDAVTINTVNNGLGNLPNHPICPAVNPEFYINNDLDTTLVFDGLTTMIEARAAVLSGQPYHIKLGVGDAQDFDLDSGVFLEAGSLESEVSTSVRAASRIQLAFDQAGGFLSVYGLSPGTTGLQLVDAAGRSHGRFQATGGAARLPTRQLCAGPYVLIASDVSGGSTAVRFIVAP